MGKKKCSTASREDFEMIYSEIVDTVMTFTSKTRLSPCLRQARYTHNTTRTLTQMKKRNVSRLTVKELTGKKKKKKKEMIK